MLELRDLVKHYQVGSDDVVRAVDGVSLTVAAGQFVVMCGPSGSGKTTLIELIAGLQQPNAGSVLVDGRDVVRMSRKEGDEYRLNVLGMVRGPHTLQPGARAVDSAALKLLMSGVRKAPKRAAPLLTQLGLGARLHHKTEQLSTGERQRVLIARALSRNPKLLLADEPTGNLDSERTQEVLELLLKVCRERGMALLLVTHDVLAAAPFADQVHELRDGRLEEYRPENLLVPASLPWRGD